MPSSPRSSNASRKISRVCPWMTADSSLAGNAMRRVGGWAARSRERRVEAVEVHRARAEADGVADVPLRHAVVELEGSRAIEGELLEFGVARIGAERGVERDRVHSDLAVGGDHVDDEIATFR